MPYDHVHISQTLFETVHVFGNGIDSIERWYLSYSMKILRKLQNQCKESYSDPKMVLKLFSAIFSNFPVSILL
jgi:hypothetical protein